MSLDWDQATVHILPTLLRRGPEFMSTMELVSDTDCTQPCCPTIMEKMQLMMEHLTDG